MDFLQVAYVLALLAVTQAQRNLNSRRRGTASQLHSKNCERKYEVISLNHTACLDEVKLDKYGLTRHERNHIVHQHNKYRGDVDKYGQPEPANILRMAWDEELEMLAQKWASNCRYMHDSQTNRFIPGRFTVGQNVGWTTLKDWSFVMDAWFNEHQHFEYGAGSTDGGPIGHYTQMIWATSSRIGCGYAFCNGTKHFYVCNYGPMGNIEDVSDPSSTYRPYEIGAKGLACPETYHKHSGTCDCGGKVCYNGGTLDVATCECKCANRPWINSTADCSLDCSQASDVFICESAGGPWTGDKCYEAVNIPYDYCPVTCKLCPVNADSYFESKSARKGTLSRAVPGTRKDSSENLGSSKKLSRDQAVINSVKIIQSETSTTAKPVRHHHKKRHRHRSHRVGTKGSTLPVCQRPDPPKCGQPNKVGYWPPEFCTKYNSIATMCKAMCGKCTVSSCKGMDGNTYQLGDSWISKHGRLSCTQNGVHFQTGCFHEENFIPEGSIYRYTEGKYNWKCTCNDTRNKLRLECTGSWNGS